MEKSYLEPTRVALNQPPKAPEAPTNSKIYLVMLGTLAILVAYFVAKLLYPNGGLNFHLIGGSGAVVALACFAIAICCGKRASEVDTSKPQQAESAVLSGSELLEKFKAHRLSVALTPAPTVTIPADSVEIGSGATGRVFKTKEGVVIKVVPPEYLHLLQNEFELGRKLNHPNIMGIKSADEPTDISPWLYLELVEGTPLATVIDKLQFKDALKLTGQFLSAIVHMVERGVFPYDLLNLRNLIIEKDHSNLKIIDLGCYLGPDDEKSFETSLSNILGVLVQFVVPHEDKLKNTPFYQMLPLDMALWDRGLKELPPLKDGKVVSQASTSEEKAAHMLAYLKELQKAFVLLS